MDSFYYHCAHTFYVLGYWISLIGWKLYENLGISHVIKTNTLTKLNKLPPR